MKPIKEILERDNNDNINTSNIDNSIGNSKYALSDKFVPRTPETSTAEEIAFYLKDTRNYAFYRFSVQKAGEQKARELWSETKEDIRLGELSGRPIRNPAALFNWKIQKFLGKENV